MTLLRNVAPAATIELAAKRSVLNHVHAARYHALGATHPTIEAILTALLADLGASGRVPTVHGDDLAADRQANLRAQWQYANGWLKDCRRGQAARTLGRRASCREEDQWAARPTWHADVATCTGGTAAGGLTASSAPLLGDVLRGRCRSDVCGPVFARIDAERAQ